MSDKHLKLFNADSSVFDDIRDWAEKRGLYQAGDSKTQLIKLGEEFGELCDAFLKQKDFEVYDAVGDIIVVLTNLIKLYEQERIDSDECVMCDNQKSYYTKIENNTVKVDCANCVEITIEDCIYNAYQEIKNRKGKMSNGNFVKDDKS